MGSRLKIATLLLLLLFSLHAGCISLGPAPPQGNTGKPQTTPQPVSGGAPSIEDITSRNAPKISLADVITILPTAGQEGILDTTGMVITKVWGYGVDSTGLASTWVLGMVGNGNSALLSYTDGKWKLVDLPTTLPANEVKIGEMVSPQGLFNRNLKTILPEMTRMGVGEVDLALDSSTYQVTLHSATDSTTLTFNARTGELIPSP